MEACAVLFPTDEVKTDAVDLLRVRRGSREKRGEETARLTDRGPTCSDVGQHAGEAGLALTVLAPRWLRGRHLRRDNWFGWLLRSALGQTAMMESS